MSAFGVLSPSNMGADNYITAKVQEAICAFLRAQNLGDIPPDQIYKGIEHPESEDTNPQKRKLPCVECVCQNADPDDEHFLNWAADAEVRIRTNADDTTEDEHHAIAATVFNKLTTDTLKADLTSALADFTVFLVNFGPQGWDLAERSWQSYLRFQVHCAGSNIS